MDGLVYLTDFVSEAELDVSNFDRLSMAGMERVHCFDAVTGQPVWSHQSPVTYAISYPKGPRTTPLVDEDRVYTLGAQGLLICFQRASGQLIWSRQLTEDYRTTAPLWGYAAHPMIDGDKLICIAGGQGSHTVALDKRTGRELWRYGTASEQGYCPVQIIHLAASGSCWCCVPTGSPPSIPKADASTGTGLPGRQRSVIMTPVVVQNRYLFVGGFNKRSLLLQLDQQHPSGGADPR